MWNKKSTTTKRRSGAADTLITIDTKISGDVNFTGVLFVDGIIKGNVTAEPGSHSVLTIGAHGHVEGEIHVPQVNIYGYINGDVHATESLNLFKDATIEGDVYYNLLQMAMGSTVNGKLVRKDASRKLLDHQPEAEKDSKSSKTNNKKDS